MVGGNNSGSCSLFAAVIFSFFLFPSLTGAQIHSGQWASVLQQNEKSFSATAESLQNCGFRPVSLDMGMLHGQLTYTSSWIRSQGLPWIFIAPISPSALKDSLPVWSHRGFEPSLLTATDSIGSKFAAILDSVGAVKKNATPAWTLTGLDRQGFLAVCDSGQRKGYKPVWVDVYESAKGPRFSGIWKRNEGGPPWNYSIGDDEKSLRIKMKVFSRVWVRPRLVAPLPGGRYFTVWEENAVGAWSAHLDLPDDNLAAELNSEAEKGLYPICLQQKPGGVGHAVLFATHLRPLARKWTVRGPFTPGFEGFDAYMRTLMTKSGVRAGALAIARNGKLVFSHGYTWAEKGYPQTEPNSLFRVASCSKPLTSILVHGSLQESGGSGSGPSLKEKILSLLPGNGDDEGPRKPADARFLDITVDQLLTHSGGWARSKQHPDPVFNDYPPGSEIRKRLPESRNDFLKYMLGQPLQFAPGTRFVYDNFGFFLLGRMLESLPMGIGKSYEALAREKIFSPLGLSRPRFGGSRFEERAPGEVLYHTAIPYLQNSLGPVGAPWVPGGYGDFNMENMDAAGAWILSAPDYAKVLASFDLEDGNPILSRQGVATMWAPTGSEETLRGWFAVNVPLADGKTATAKWHSGLFPGTSTLVFYHPDKWSFALFLNRDLPHPPSGEKEGLELTRLAESIQSWPAADLFPIVGIPSFIKSSPPSKQIPTATAGR